MCIATGIAVAMALGLSNSAPLPQAESPSTFTLVGYIAELPDRYGELDVAFNFFDPATGELAHRALTTLTYVNGKYMAEVPTGSLSPETLYAVVAANPMAPPRLQEAAPHSYVRLQESTPGTAQVGNANISGRMIAGTFQGNGALITSLNASNISSGTLSDARLSSNIPRLNAANVWTANNRFNGRIGVKMAPLAGIDVSETGATGIRSLTTGSPGVRGESSSTVGDGVFGVASSATGSSWGVRGLASSTSGRGGSFTASASTGVTYGVYGQAFSPDGHGGHFRNSAAGGVALYARGNNNAAVALWADGVSRVRVLEITGADLAEAFEVDDLAKPGKVMEIDPDNPGKLRVSQGEYNRRVAGIVSGANGLEVGIVLNREGDMPEGHAPVALSGRVWVYADATEREIEIGDMLTTAERPGHAMAVRDYTRAQGAIIGKAMSSLKKGETGLVLVLVNLQ